MVPLRREEYLRLMLQPAERLAVQNPVAVPLESGTDRTGFQRKFPHGVSGELQASDERVFFSSSSVCSRMVIHLLLPPLGTKRLIRAYY